MSYDLTQNILISDLEKEIKNLKTKLKKKDEVIELLMGVLDVKQTKAVALEILVMQYFKEPQ